MLISIVNQQIPIGLAESIQSFYRKKHVHPQRGALTIRIHCKYIQVISIYVTWIRINYCFTLFSGWHLSFIFGKWNMGWSSAQLELLLKEFMICWSDWFISTFFSINIILLYNIYLLIYNIFRLKGDAMNLTLTFHNNMLGFG